MDRFAIRRGANSAGTAVFAVEVRIMDSIGINKTLCFCVATEYTPTEIASTNPNNGMIQSRLSQDAFPFLRKQNRKDVFVDGL
jgi:hypothetical protein